MAGAATRQGDVAWLHRLVLARPAHVHQGKLFLTPFAQMVTLVLATEHPLETSFGSKFRLDVAMPGGRADGTGVLKSNSAMPSMGARR
jgi:hypothetical protein